MSEIRKKIADIAWPAVAVLLLFLLLTYGCTLMKPSPARYRIGPVATGEHSMYVSWPYGHQHELVLGVPEGEWGHPPDVVASVRVADAGGTLATLLVHPTNMVSCSWLNQSDVQGFILTWPNTNAWDHSLVAGQRYSIHCEFSGGLASNASLWVSCLQSGLDRWRTRRNRTSP